MVTGVATTSAVGTAPRIRLLAVAIAATLAAATAHQLFLLAAEATAGNTTRSIAAGLRIVTERLRTDLGELHAVTHSPTVKRVPVSRLAGRAAIFRAPAEELV